MNRRNFFKVATGFIAGVCAAVVPKVKGVKRSGTRLATKDEVDWASQTWIASKEDIKALGSGNCKYYDPTLIWAKEMAKLHNKAIDEMIISCI